MKKTNLLIIGIILIVGVFGYLIFFAGGNDSVDLNNGNSENKEPQNDKITLKYQNVNITPGSKFDKNNITGDVNVAVIPSCAFDGNDNVYTYDNLEITTNVNNGEEKIYSVYFLNSSINTTEGLKIGDSVTTLKEKYPKSSEEDGVFTYLKDGVKITFLTNNGIITSIEYALNIA